MGNLRLDPPFGHERLEKIEAISRKQNLNVEATARWLLEHGNARSMTSAIRNAWSGTKLPLRDWATSISCVEAWTTEKDGGLWLRVCFSEGKVESVAQSAPFDEKEFSDRVREFPAPVPSILKDLALAAPGLMIGDVGPVAARRFFEDRLGIVTAWMECLQSTPERAEEVGVVFPDPRIFLVEVATNGQALPYVLDTEGKLYFGEFPDLPGLIPCSVSLEEFIQTFFDDPDKIIAPYDPGWATYPTRGGD